MTTNDFLTAIRKNAARVTGYRLGRDGSDGWCDCIGLLIGALRLAGVKYTHTHGSNYFARNQTKGLKQVSKAKDLDFGDVIYKAHLPGESGYDADTIRRSYAGSSDQRDYYHVGVVMSVSPLQIWHCSTGGMHYDTKMGRWGYAGKIAYISNAADLIKEAGVTGRAVVDVPNNGTVNVRAKPNGDIQDKLREGTSVYITEDDGTWSKVEYTQIGYIMSKYLREESG